MLWLTGLAQAILIEWMALSAIVLRTYPKTWVGTEGF